MSIKEVERKAKRQVRLMDMIETMRYYNSRGYSCHIQGNGDGSISVIAEEEMITI